MKVSKRVIGTGAVVLVLIILYVVEELVQYEKPASNRCKQDGCDVISTNTSAQLTPESENQNIRYNHSFRSPALLEVGPKQKIGTWYGDTWVPPQGWKTYSTKEVQEIFGNKSVLFVGSSLARRAATTLWYVLNVNLTLTNGDLSESILTEKNYDTVGNQTTVLLDGWNDWYFESSTQPCELFDQQSHPYFCPRMPNRKDKFLASLYLGCFIWLESWLDRELKGLSDVLQQADVVVFALGEWENNVFRPEGRVNYTEENPNKLIGCRNGVNNRSVEQLVTDSLNKIVRLIRKNQTIIWRTAGWILTPNKTIHDSASSMHLKINNAAMNYIDNYNMESNSFRGLTYVDWGKTMRPKSAGNAYFRTPDDPIHYKGTARAVLIQMLANAITEVGRNFD